MAVHLQAAKTQCSLRKLLSLLTIFFKFTVQWTKINNFSKMIKQSTMSYWVQNKKKQLKFTTLSFNALLGNICTLKTATIFSITFDIKLLSLEQGNVISFQNTIELSKFAIVHSSLIFMPVPAALCWWDNKSII